MRGVAKMSINKSGTMGGPRLPVFTSFCVCVFVYSLVFIIFQPRPQGSIAQKVRRQYSSTHAQQGPSVTSQDWRMRLSVDFAQKVSQTCPHNKCLYSSFLQSISQFVLGIFLVFPDTHTGRVIVTTLLRHGFCSVQQNQTFYKVPGRTRKTYRRRYDVVALNFVLTSLRREYFWFSRHPYGFILGQKPGKNSSH